MKPWPPHVYAQEASTLGVPAEVTARALAYAASITRVDPRLPVVLTLHHLSELTGISHKFLRAVVARLPSARPYTEFFISKRSGRKRRICVPRDLLRQAQQWINQSILRLLPTHSASYAYSPGASAIDCARLHCGARWLIKLDVENFFESISEIQVYRVFRSLGYQPLISFEMARICTHVIGEGGAEIYGNAGPRLLTNPKATSAIVNYKQQRLGVLPQGAPTSPMLSNAAMRDFDSSVLEIARRFSLTYTRYADDLVFSSSAKSFSRRLVPKLIASVFERMRKEGLNPNSAKTQISPPSARKIVLGLQVDGPAPRLRREFREQLEQHVYFIRRRGPQEHCRHLGFSSVLGFKYYLGGLLNYANQVEPLFALPLIEKFNQAPWPI